MCESVRYVTEGAMKQSIMVEARDGQTEKLAVCVCVRYIAEEAEEHFLALTDMKEVI